MFAFEFFLKFWTFVWTILSSLSFLFQKYKYFEIGPKLTFLRCFFMELFSLRKNSYFLENRYQNVKVLWDEFQCYLILWVTMWEHCEWRWIPFITISQTMCSKSFKWLLKTFTIKIGTVQSKIVLNWNFSSMQEVLWAVRNTWPIIQPLNGAKSV